MLRDAHQSAVGSLTPARDNTFWNVNPPRCGQAGGPAGGKGREGGDAWRAGQAGRVGRAVLQKKLLYLYPQPSTTKEMLENSGAGVETNSEEERLHEEDCEDDSLESSFSIFKAL